MILVVHPRCGGWSYGEMWLTSSLWQSNHDVRLCVARQYRCSVGCAAMLVRVCFLFAGLMLCFCVRVRVRVYVCVRVFACLFGFLLVSMCACVRRCACLERMML